MIWGINVEHSKFFFCDFNFEVSFDSLVSWVLTDKIPFYLVRQCAYSSWGTQRVCCCSSKASYRFVDFWKSWLDIFISWIRKMYGCSWLIISQVVLDFRGEPRPLLFQETKIITYWVFVEPRSSPLSFPHFLFAWPERSPSVVECPWPFL